MIRIKLPPLKPCDLSISYGSQVRVIQIEAARATLEAAAVAATNTELPADDRYIAGIVAGTIRAIRIEGET